MKLEISLKRSTLKLAGEILMVGVDNPNNRVTLASGDQTTLEELLGGPVKLELVNEDVLMKKKASKEASETIIEAGINSGGIYCEEHLCPGVYESHRLADDRLVGRCCTCGSLREFFVTAGNVPERFNNNHGLI